MKHSLPILLFALSIVATPGFAGDATTQEDKVYRTPVTALTVGTATISRNTRVQGVIESTQTPRLKARVSAEVVAVNVDEGDVVSKGQELARLDDEGFRLDAKAARADIARLDALLENLRQTLRREESLMRDKLVSQSRLDDARAALRQASAQRAQAKARLAQVEYQLSHTRIVAPIDGVVQQRSVSVGDYVNPMSPSTPTLFQLVDTRHLRARLYFPESLASAIHAGMTVTLHGGGKTLAAKITRLRPMLEARNRALHALAEFDNTPDWKPGRTITADVELARHENAIVVPARAVVQRASGPVVYRLADGKAREVPVKTGISQDGRIEITAGLHAGDVIAVDGAPFLADGVPVLIQSEHEAQP